MVTLWYGSNVSNNVISIWISIPSELVEMGGFDHELVEIGSSKKGGKEGAVCGTRLLIVLGAGGLVWPSPAWKTADACTTINLPEVWPKHTGHAAGRGVYSFLEGKSRPSMSEH